LSECVDDPSTSAGLHELPLAQHSSSTVATISVQNDNYAVDEIFLAQMMRRSSSQAKTQFAAYFQMAKKAAYQTV